MEDGLTFFDKGGRPKKNAIKKQLKVKIMVVALLQVT